MQVCEGEQGARWEDGEQLDLVNERADGVVEAEASPIYKPAKDNEGIEPVLKQCHHCTAHPSSRGHASNQARYMILKTTQENLV